MAEDVQVLIEPVEEPTRDALGARERWVRQSQLLELLGDPDPGRLEVYGPDLLGRKPDEHSPFRTTVFDPATNRAVEVVGRIDAPEQARVLPIALRPPPRPDELRDALAVLRRDPRFGSLADREGVVVYQPMPPLADLVREDGTALRRPTLGIMGPSGNPPHRIVAVDVAGGTVDWAPEGVDGPTDDDCEAHLPIGVESLPDAGGPGRGGGGGVRGGPGLGTPA